MFNRQSELGLPPQNTLRQTQFDALMPSESQACNCRCLLLGAYWQQVHDVHVAPLQLPAKA